MASKPLIPPNKVTRSLTLECEKLYPSVLEAVYKEQRPKSNLKDILEDDKWRFRELPNSLKPGDGLSKNQLARLVRWKITHGVYRPFLPGMIQKNSESEVSVHTVEAAKVVYAVSRKQAQSSISKTITSALDQVCKLKGVGPATGTLVLSVFNPDIVPFFQDELFAWFVPDHTAKLKYDKKEYNLLLGRTLDVLLEKDIEARLLEKTAYVLMYPDLLTEEQKSRLKLSCESDIADNADQSSQTAPEITTKVNKTKKPNTGPRSRSKRSQEVREKSPLEEEELNRDRSKRRKK